jgi:hypothetical protein
VAHPPNVVLFCPVRETPEILSHALDAHARLRDVGTCWYFDDNEDPASSEMLGGAFSSLLRARQFLIPAALLPAREDYRNHKWTPEAVARVTAVKDEAIERFLLSDADALFLIDADMIPHPNLVTHLLSLNLPVVSEVCWSKWKEDEPWMPNAWDFHGYGFHSPERVTRLRVPGVYDVGGLGGCTLIRREVLEAGARFARVPGLNEWGEDRHFCTRIAALGFPLNVDTTLPLFHVYRPAQIEEMVRWREEGSDPWAFEAWLTDEWETEVLRSMMPAAPRVIACCFPGETFYREVSCFWSDLQAHMIRKGLHPVAMYGEMSNPHGVRELLRSQVIESRVPIDLVLWLDDDQLLSAAQFDRLLSDLDALPEAAMVAGWTWCDTGEDPVISAGIMAGDAVRCVPFSEVMKAEGVFEVEWTGFPAVLMRASLLRDAGPLPFAPILAPRSQWGYTGEDVSFCVNAKARCGARVFIDPKVFVPHLKVKALSLDGSPKSIQTAVQEAAAMLAGQVEVRFKEEALV